MPYLTDGQHARVDALVHAALNALAPCRTIAECVAMLLDSNDQQLIADGVALMRQVRTSQLPALAETLNELATVCGPSRPIVAALRAHAVVLTAGLESLADELEFAEACAPA